MFDREGEAASQVTLMEIATLNRLGAILWATTDGDFTMARELAAECRDPAARRFVDHERERPDGWPRYCVVYFIRSGSDGPIKIGFSSSLKDRFADLSRMNGQPITLLGWIRGELEDERALHVRFSASRLHGEWFSPTSELLRLILSEARAA